MSRSRAALLAITVAAALVPVRVGAQSAQEPVTAETAAERASQVFTVDRGPPCRPEGTPGEIVVCGDTGEDQRVFPPSTSTDTGELRSPNVGKSHEGNIVVYRGCVIPPRKCPPQPLIIDIDAIPVAPPGSDADLIGKGELRAD